MLVVSPLDIIKTFQKLLIYPLEPHKTRCVPHTLIGISELTLASYRLHTGSAKYLFFEYTLKKTTEYFLKFLFLFESTVLPLNNGK